MAHNYTPEIQNKSYLSADILDIPTKNKKLKQFPSTSNHLGDKIMVMVRPSNLGCCST